MADDLNIRATFDGKQAEKGLKDLGGEGEKSANRIADAYKRASKEVSSISSAVRQFQSMLGIFSTPPAQAPISYRYLPHLVVPDAEPTFGPFPPRHFAPCPSAKYGKMMQRADNPSYAASVFPLQKSP